MIFIQERSIFRSRLIKSQKNNQKHHLIKGNFPFPVGNSPFYYGWIILVAGSLGVLFSIPGQTMGVSVYTDHLIAGLGLSRIEISTAYMIGTLTSSLLMTKAGIFYDKFGARVAAAGSAFFLGIFLFFLSRSVQITGILTSLTGLPATGIAFSLMIIGFLGIRFFGQGVLTLVSRGMVMRWFEVHRGFAAALMGIVTSFGFSYSPRALEALIRLTSWETSWILIGAALVVLVVPFIIIVFRDSPEDCQMEMEQGVRIRTGNREKARHHGSDSTLKQARRDPQFWFYLALLFYWALYNTAFTFHITSIFSSLGLDPVKGIAIFLPISIVSVISSFAGNWLSDIIKMKTIFYVMIAAMFGAAFALTIPWGRFSSLMLISGLGIGGGLFSVVTSIAWPKLYGRKHLGAISGMAMSFIVAGSALGPWLFSLMEKISGDYSMTGWFGMIFTLVIGLASLPVLIKAEK